MASIPATANMIDVNAASARVRERWRLRCLTAKNRRGAGNFKPGVTLLVGERVSHPDESEYHAPFCSVRASSGWLNTLLARSRVCERNLFWINALENDGTFVDLGELVRELRPANVIALGKVAEARLSVYNIEHDAVPHPQYWKRFKSKDPYPLIKKLEQLHA